MSSREHSQVGASHFAAGPVINRRVLLKSASLAVGAFGLGSTLSACGGDEPAGDSASGDFPKLKVRVGSADPPPPGQRSRMMEWWEQQITKKTNGAVTFQNYWAGSIAGSGELLEAIQNNVVDAAAYSASWAEGKLPLWNFELAVPFRPNEPRLYNKIMHKLVDTVPAFTEEYAKYGVRILNLTPMEEGYDVHSKERIATFDDFRGKKIAAPGTWMPKFVSAAGGTPVTMPAPDRYQGLQSGVIDGHILSLQWSSDFKLTEVAKYWLEVGIGNTSPGGIAVSETFWKTLSPELQKIFSETAVEAETYLFDLFDQDGKKYREAAQQAGVSFLKMSDADKASWANAMDDYPSVWAKQVTAQGKPGWEVIDAFNQLCSDEGWTWVRKWGTDR